MPHHTISLESYISLLANAGPPAPLLTPPNLNVFTVFFVLMTTPFKTFMDAFMTAVPDHIDDHAKGIRQVELPVIPCEGVAAICEKAAVLFANEPNILTLQSPIIVIGDLHGHILDLYRILLALGSPDPRTYLFLGDIVDRGEFSVETVILVFLMKILWPLNVYVIRGNHEFDALCSTGGFRAQVLDLYSDMRVYAAFTRAFSVMPLIALIDRDILCVHGGLAPEWEGFDQIMNVRRPLVSFGSPVVDGILWSDPRDSVDTYGPSPRGVGFLFGKEAVEEFCKAHKLRVIIRAHECVSNGYQLMFDGKCATVFSASNYCGTEGNKGAVLHIHRGQLEPFRFPPLAYLRRENVSFFRPFDGPPTPGVCNRSSYAHLKDTVPVEHLPRIRAASRCHKARPPVLRKTPLSATHALVKPILRPNSRLL